MKEIPLSKPCCHCGNEKGLAVESPTQHAGQMICSECHRYQKWITKPMMQKYREQGCVTHDPVGKLLLKQFELPLPLGDNHNTIGVSNST